MDDIHDFTVEHETYAYYVNCHMKYERCVKLGLLSEVIHSTENKASSDKKRRGTVFPNAEKTWTHCFVNQHGPRVVCIACQSGSCAKMAQASSAGPGLHNIFSTHLDHL